jgi:hypothetical protein
MTDKGYGIIDVNIPKHVTRGEVSLSLSVGMYHQLIEKS